MTLYNDTPIQVFYSITGSSSADCGTIDPGQKADWPSYDNQNNVGVAFEPNSGSGFSVTIPKSKPGMAVTIGIFLE
jgi:hypothetical protein